MVHFDQSHGYSGGSASHNLQRYGAVCTYVHMHEQHIRLYCTDTAITLQCVLGVDSVNVTIVQVCIYACVVKTLLKARGKEPVCLLLFISCELPYKNMTSTQIRTAKVTYTRT